VPSAANIICLLDDEATVLKSIARLLASDGLHAEKFSDPACFLAHARSHPVQLAVIDIRMTGMTGFEVLSELRALNPAPKVIVMTGENDPTHREAALAGGACAFFRKPFDNEAFLVAVRQAIAPSL
jgi:FixJ family two-component response regulator